MSIVQNGETKRFIMVCNGCGCKLDAIGDETREAMMRLSSLEGWQTFTTQNVHFCEACKEPLPRKD